MPRSLRKRKGLVVTGCLACLLWGAELAFATDPEVLELKARIERLEKQNQMLLQQMEQQRPPGEAAREPSTGEAACSGPRDMQTILIEHLRAEDEKKKQVEELKKQADGEKFVEVGSDLSGKVFWRNGLIWESANKDFALSVGGRIQNDWAWFAPDGSLDPRGWNDGAFFRRLRTRMTGKAWEVINFQLEFDFANTSPTVKDTYMEVTQLPHVGTFRAGHFYEPFSLENWGTSDNWISFIERAPVIDALDPERNIGVILYNTYFQERVFAGAGIFRPGSEENTGFVGDSGDGEYAYTGRLTFNPVYEADGRCWVHFGGAYSYRSTLQNPLGSLQNPIGDPPRFRSRIPLRARGTTVVNNERVVDTGVLLADSVQLFNLQAAMAAGPFSVQGEVLAAQVNDLVRGPVLRNPSFWGYYVFASYFLTGEHRPYIRRIGGIGMPVPHEPFFYVKAGDGCNSRNIFGRGAWEVLVRYDYLDLGSPGINQIGTGPGAIPATSVFQGHLQDVTLGLNWYLNPNFRIMWNYVYSHINGLEVSPQTRSGDVHSFGMRFSFFF